MTYDLEFDPRAFKEWHELTSSIKEQFKKKLAEILSNPRVEANKLRNLKDCYKIKLRSAGYRLVYQVQDKKLVVYVIVIGKRERSSVYSQAKKRVNKQ